MRGESEKKEAHAKSRVNSNDVVAEAPKFPVGFGRSRGELAGAFTRAASNCVSA